MRTNIAITLGFLSGLFIIKLFQPEEYLYSFISRVYLTRWGDVIPCYQPGDTESSDTCIKMSYAICTGIQGIPFGCPRIQSVSIELVMLLFCMILGIKDEYIRRNNDKDKRS